MERFMSLFLLVLAITISFSSLVAPQASNNLPGFDLEYCLYDTGNYTNDSDYQNNLNHILSTLPAGNGNGYGFYNLSYGRGIDTVHAIAQCRGDSSQDLCRQCLLNATLLLPKRCPEQKDAGGWYDHCMLRYSNRSMSGGAASVNRYLRWNFPQNSSDVEGFTESLRGLLNTLKNKAASAGSLRKYAAGSTQGPDFSTIYALVQCTADLSQQDCNNCLDASFGFLSCCVGNINAGIIQSNCLFQYETNNLFFNPTDQDAPQHSSPPPESSPTPPPPTPPLPESGKGNGRRRSTTVIIIGVVSSALASLVIISACIWFRIRKKKEIINKFKSISSHEHSEEIETPELLEFSFETIKVATDNFSDENKIGEGGFGPVYKGKLSNGQVIAVKRLSVSSVQGDLEFKTAVTLVAKLQHRNLLRLLGFCFEPSERLLLFELVRNGSLDHFIFDPRKRATLDWDTRFKIVKGIARGLLYLHEDSRLRIIHRDLKASNILLDEEMNPKISDFGTAKLFQVDQTQDNTNRIVGTYGYMAPEYAMHGRFSTKSDVFSFGVLLLEILCGGKNNDIRNIREGEEESLLQSAWKNWRKGTAPEIVDPLVRQGPMSEIRRYIHIALLCVQKNEANRPTMNSVALMLNSNSISLPMPSEPGFHIHSNNNINGSNSPLYLSSRVFDSDNSVHEPVQQSVNEASITELYPR